MSRIAPANLEDLDSDTRALIAYAQDLMGFVPNDSLVMARQPALLKAMAALVGAVYGEGRVDSGLKRLIGEAASKAAGCFYCSAHAAFGAVNQGVSREKIEAVWNFEQSPLFSDAERAAISFALKAAQIPNDVTDANFASMRAHFDDGQIIEIVSVIAMFGFLNRWNSTLGTALEPAPLAGIDGLK